MQPSPVASPTTDSRLLGFSDAVFALSATLLVVTLEVPASYAELLEAVAGFPAFAIAFGLLIVLWYQHRQFFRAYPLVDAWTVAINSLLLFVVLLYVYPLKLLTQIFAERFVGIAPATIGAIGEAEIQGLFLIFGAGWVALFASYAALHLRAWLLRDSLGLDELGRFELVQDALAYLILVAAGVLSVIVAALGIGLAWGLPGLVFLLTPLATVIQQVLTAGRRRALRAGRGEPPLSAS